MFLLALIVGAIAALVALIIKQPSGIYLLGTGFACFLVVFLALWIFNLGVRFGYRCVAKRLLDDWCPSCRILPIKVESLMEISGRDGQPVYYLSRDSDLQFLVQESDGPTLCLTIPAKLVRVLDSPGSPPRISGLRLRWGRFITTEMSRLVQHLIGEEYFHPDRMVVASGRGFVHALREVTLEVPPFSSAHLKDVSPAEVPEPESATAAAPSSPDPPPIIGIPADEAAGLRPSAAAAPTPVPPPPVEPLPPLVPPGAVPAPFNTAL